MYYFIMKNFFKIFLTLLILSNFVLAQDVKEVKDKAIALYVTKNYDEAKKILESLPINQKDSETFLLLSNIAQENGNDNLAIKYLNNAIDKDNTYYRAYYNLGCILAKRKSYNWASKNFELALQFKKDFSPAYYNLALCRMKEGNYSEAKKDLIKALQYDPKNKDCMYNLAYCYKKLNKLKQAQKILDKYNEST